MKRNDIALFILFMLVTDVIVVVGVVYAPTVVMVLGYLSIAVIALGTILLLGPYLYRRIARRYRRFRRAMRQRRFARREA